MARHNYVMGCALVFGLVACTDNATQEWRPLSSAASSTAVATTIPAGSNASAQPNPSASASAEVAASASTMASASPAAGTMPSSLAELSSAELAMLVDRLDAGSMAMDSAGSGQAQSGSVVAGMAAGFRRCYNEGLKKDPKLQGSMKVSAKIGPNGEVLSAEPIAVKGLTKEVADCVTARVTKATFSPPEGGGANIIIPVSFYPQ